MLMEVFIKKSLSKLRCRTIIKNSKFLTYLIRNLRRLEMTKFTTKYFWAKKAEKFAAIMQ